MVKLEPKLVTELQELFAWNRFWKHCKLNNWNNNKPNKPARSLAIQGDAMFSAAQVLATWTQTEAALVGRG